MKLMKMFKDIDVTSQEATRKEKKEEVEAFNELIKAIAEKASSSGALGKQKMEDFFDPEDETHRVLKTLNTSELYSMFIPSVLGDFRYSVSIADEFMSLDDCLVSAFMKNSRAKAYWELELKDK